MSLLAFIGGFLLAASLPKYIQRRAWRSQWYPQPWYWLVSRKAHQKGYPDWATVKIARKMGWMK